MCARSKLIESGNVSLYSQSTLELAQMASSERSEDSNECDGKMTPLSGL
jgi:hypothetical protein